MTTPQHILDGAPIGANEYFIDYDGSINYLKDGRKMVYTPYTGWELFNLKYQESVEIKPL